MTRCGQRRRRLLRGSPATQSEAEAATAEGQRYGRAGSETAAGGSRCSQAEVSMTAAQFEGCARQLLGDAGRRLIEVQRLLQGRRLTRERRGKQRPRQGKII